MNPDLSLDLAALDLGAPAAERDIQRGLEHYFVESEAFKRVSDRTKTIILGNRGSGKSAIFKMLAARERRIRHVHVVELAPEDYSYELLRETMLREAEGSWAKLGAYAVAWKYLIYVMVMKSVAQDMPKSMSKGPAGKVLRYVRDNHAHGQHSKLSALVSYLKRLEGIKIGPYEAGLRAKELERLYRLEEIHHLLPALQEILVKEKVIVLVDELDRGWDASEDAKAFVAGLFQACMSINELSPRLTVYMSLRQELYDNIPSLYEDAQKYRDMIEVLNWNESGLQQLIARRVRHSLEDRKVSEAYVRSLTDDGLWGLLFQETLDYRKSKSFGYMIDRTLYRPRELIQLCQQAIDSARGSDTPAPLGYAVLSEAERRYSEERAKDIAAEYRFEYPNLLEVFEVFRGHSYHFDREELELLCLELVLDEKIKNPETLKWLEHLDPSAIIDVLWRVGFLRARAVGGIKAQRRSGSSYLGPHQVSNLSIATITQFQVHPMFRSYLGMKEPKGTSTRAR
ncbi:P-loop ATPase, Sll1717 family [Actinoplanes sp. RD1]|uniref:P-loop ATPase, Sll1717 family n=1 Tax=Actinoplanes sp. RD1 TaxID=3064538 RepID=UPI002740620F|nr:hypothetical protein [Actinoplanes sp. RD1]